MARKRRFVGKTLRDGVPLWGFLSAAIACGPPPSTSTPAAGAASLDAGGADAEAAPDPVFDGAVEEAEPAPVEVAFRRVLAALLEGSARGVREMVPGGGLLVLSSNVCRKPLYGVGTCREERVEAERRRIDDEVLAPFQELLSRAAGAGDGFAIDELAATCTEGEGRRWRCGAELWLGADECRGDQRVPVGAVLLDGGDGWVLVELTYEESILVCD